MKHAISILACALIILASSPVLADYADELRKRADSGDLSALITLGEAYKFGAQDYHKANECWLKALQHPGWNTADADARGKTYFNLGLHYDMGQGVRQDYRKAVEYYGKAAELGDAKAMVSLGLHYHEGQGVRQDRRRAKEYFGKACDRGEQNGCNEYRKMNEEGY